jgi:hypothetical protein
MLVKPEWIEVGDIIYFDDTRYFDQIVPPKVVIAKIDEKNWSLGDEIDGDKICEMMYWKESYWIGDNGWDIRLYKQIDQNWIRDKKITEICQYQTQLPKI